MQEYLKIIIAVLIPNIGGLVGGLITTKNIPNWYNQLNQPSCRPPNWVFGPVWTLLYSSMGFASYLIWRDGDGFIGTGRLPLILYCIQLALNWIWTPIFFGLHNLKWAFIDLVGCAAATIACCVFFFGVNNIAGFILLPYIAWLCFAGRLNFCIWRLNTVPNRADDKD